MSKHDPAPEPSAFMVRLSARVRRFDAWYYSQHWLVRGALTLAAVAFAAFCLTVAGLVVAR